MSSSTPWIACSCFSMRLVTSRSAVSGEAPGYGMSTTISGRSTSGFWLTFSLDRASSPMAIIATMITIVAIGFLTLKLDRNILFSLLIFCVIELFRCAA